MNKMIVYAILLGLIGTWLVVGINSNKETESTSNLTSHRNSDAGEIDFARDKLAVLKKIDQLRKMNVIVRLNTDYGSEKEKAIQSAQNLLKRELKGTGYVLKREYRFIPFVALTINHIAAKRLVNLKVVAGVSEEAYYFPNLEDTSLVDANWNFKNNNDGKGVAVAIIDSGIVTHTFFGQNRNIEEFCFASDASCQNGEETDDGPESASCDIQADCAHGTHVAGIAAGRNNSLSGIASGTNIIMLKATSELCNILLECRHIFQNSDIIAALEKVLELAQTQQIAAVNMSFGGRKFAEDCDDYSENEQATKAVVDLLKVANVATIAASGNAGEPEQISRPACISSIISVGATDKELTVADFSNSSDVLDLLATGVDVRSSVPGGFERFNGTSMAAPHVTGAWAVLKSSKLDASVDEILDSLKQSGRSITDERQGRVRPLIQVEDALQHLQPVTVNLTPNLGIHQTPHEVRVSLDHIVDARTLKVWMTKEPAAPIVEDSASASLICEGEYRCRHHDFTITEPGLQVARVKVFYDIANGIRLNSNVAEGVFQLDDPLPGPQNIQASDGEFEDRVRITWSPVYNAMRYEIFRTLSTYPPSASATSLASVDADQTSYDHIVQYGTGDMSYYFIRAIVEATFTSFPTLFGGPDAGHALIASLAIEASDGTEANGILLNWDPIPWNALIIGLYYELYRGTSNNYKEAQLIATIEGIFENNYPNGGIINEPAPRTYLDQDARAGKPYFYWVLGIDGDKRTRFGEGDSGFIKSDSFPP